MLPQGLAGKYDVQQEIAQGAMGIVYKALDLKLNRMVALKVVHPYLTNDTSFLQRFLREARAMARLQHDNIVTIYSVEQDQGTQFMVMEYFPGTNLHGRMQPNIGLPVAQALSITHQIAKALSYAHAHGIIHRDVKPANVLVGHNDHVKLTDFGIAAALDEAPLTTAGQLIGTLLYMSPEQAKDAGLDGRSDLYSLGLMLYEMLTGTHPRRGLSNTAVLGMLANEAASPTLSFSSEIPPGVQTLVTDLLRYRPTDRVKDAQQLIDRLDTIQTGGRPMPRFTPQPTALADDRTICELPEATPSVRPDSSQRGQSLRPSREKQPGMPWWQFWKRDDRTICELPEAVDASIDSSAGESTQIIDIWRETPSGEPLEPIKSEQFRPRVSVTFSCAADPGLIGRSIPLITTPFVIGRSVDANLAILSDLAISRSHCTIDWHEGAYIVRSLSNTNSLWVDGCAVPHDKPQPLRSGSILRLSSKTVLTFVFNDVCELPDLCGIVIEDRYKLISQIRSSSKAAHYKANALRLPQLVVAIKILSPILAEYPGYLDELIREAETAAGLKHPHIAGVLDFGVTTVQMPTGALKLHYVCMEYLEGGNLEEQILDSQLQTPAQVCEWLVPVGAAIDYAHRNGVVHGGLKTTSIIFDGERKPYVTDFASATYAQNSKHRILLGSPDFLAPEQWEGLRPTPATDQYALAVLVYFMLCGALPFEAQQDPSRRERNFARGAEPVHKEAWRKANIEIQQSISAVVGKGMAVRPEDRYPSMHEFTLAFQKAMSEQRNQCEAMPEVFFSYRRDTGTAWAALFSSELKRQGISVFVDMQRRDNVVRFPAWLESAIQNCDIFVCLLSEATLDSTWVQHEIQTAYNLGKPMIPIIQEDFKFPISGQSMAPHIDALLAFQGVPLLDRKGVYIDPAIADVAKMVHEHVSKKPK